MRRTGEVFEEEVGTSGPVLPYLFGRGSLMNRQLIGQGVKVRATGIADAVPALSIGRKIDQANPPVNGFAGLAVSVALWNELVNGPEQSESIGQRLIYFPAVVDVEQLPLVVGSSIDRQLAASEIQQAIIGTCYLPIYTNVPIGSSVERVIGFGLADVVVINPTTVQITASISRIVKENASAVLTIAIDSAGFDECMTLNKQLEQPLLAPVSVR
jgi:hypothetical protein